MVTSPPLRVVASGFLPRVAGHDRRYFCCDLAARFTASDVSGVGGPMLAMNRFQL